MPVLNGPNLISVTVFPHFYIHGNNIMLYRVYFLLTLRMYSDVLTKD